MSKPIIEIQNISKCYRIGAHKEPYLSLRGEISKLTSRTSATFSNILSNIWHPTTSNKQQATSNETDFWALKDVSFSVQEGEVVGIIGRNGAGKSTLLKILSQITPPTQGQIIMRGRVASLLEVGTGFHPELTGRENIFLNGTILGMSRKEVARKFDEIVAFAEIDKFLDTPVKRYSSGMYVRLAFAVAAHLEPEILVIDEVLAVGDAQFQKKCLGKMSDIAKHGRTVLFVSHNMLAVQSLCSSAIMLSRGRAGTVGKSAQIIDDYLKSTRDNLSISLKDRTDRTGKGNIVFTNISVSEFKVNNMMKNSKNLLVSLNLTNFFEYDVKVRLSLSIRSTLEVGLISCDSALKGELYTIPGKSETIIDCSIFSPPLNPSEYYINIAVFYGEQVEDWITSAAVFTIQIDGEDNRISANNFPVFAKFTWNLGSSKPL